MRATVAIALFATAACAQHKPAGEASAAPAPAPTRAPAPSLTPTPAPRAPHLNVLTHSLAIHADATLKGKPLGALAAGDSVPLRDDPPASAPACPSVRAIAPRGWVCADDAVATLDDDNPVWRALSAHAPDYAASLPYAYGESRGARRHRTLAGVDDPAWPAALLDRSPVVAPRSTLAWLDEVTRDGTTWVRASDMSYVRKDRVTPYGPYDGADFHGVALGGDVALPLAFFKHGPHARLRRDDAGHLVPIGETWPRLAWVGLTGRSEKHGRATFWETRPEVPPQAGRPPEGHTRPEVPPQAGRPPEGHTRDDGVWIDARDAAIVAPSAAPPDGPHPTWIEIAALGGWLVAYEGDKPVYATMISAGKLGAARPDPDHEPHQPPATTPLGTFRIKEKLVTATLQSDLDDGTELVHAEVPWSQRFYDKYLLHTAYWHDAWGEGHSGGCVNLSPLDARWLFGWTIPKLPDGWHAVRAQDGDDDPATIIVLHV